MKSYTVLNVYHLLRFRMLTVTLCRNVSLRNYNSVRKWDSGSATTSLQNVRHLRPFRFVDIVSM